MVAMFEDVYAAPESLSHIDVRFRLSTLGVQPTRCAA